VAPHRWHLQETGTGPAVLLLHGAGASTHSWRALIPALAAHHRVVALDLPGQGFTRMGTKSRSGLDAMARDIAALCRAQGIAPTAIVGHSAGAALALELAGRFDPVPAVIGINAALDRFEGVAGWLFPVLARLLALNPFSALALTLGGDPLARARRLIESTGSTLDAEGYALYARLLSDRAHVDGTLRMMAQWDVSGLSARLPGIGARTLFVVGKADTAVPPAVSERAARAMPWADLVHLPGLGHLAHEEDPATVVRLVLEWCTA